MMLRPEQAKRKLISTTRYNEIDQNNQQYNEVMRQEKHAKASQQDNRQIQLTAKIERQLTRNKEAYEKKRKKHLHEMKRINNKHLRMSLV